MPAGRKLIAHRDARCGKSCRRQQGKLTGSDSTHKQGAVAARTRGFCLMTIPKRIFSGVTAAILAFGAADLASAQQDDNWLRRLFQQPSASAVPGSFNSSATTGWSGQSGMSGNPLMTADAIRAAAADFGNCLERLWPEAARRGISRASFEQFTASLTPDLSIMDKLDAQPEFTKSTWDYLDALVSDERIARGRELLVQHATMFAAVARTYGVEPAVLAAIWGVESNYGTLGGDRPVIRSTATLACIGRRQDYFREEFLSTLEILQRGDVPADHLVGSWAGAFGPTQFMPTSFKRYAVDFDGDGRRDVVDSIPYVIASTANNLKMDGWIAGQPWGYAVVLPAGFDYLLADRSRQMTLRQWESLGVRRAAGGSFREPDARAYLLLPAGARGPARSRDTAPMGRRIAFALWRPISLEWQRARRRSRAWLGAAVASAIRRMAPNRGMAD